MRRWHLALALLIALRAHPIAADAELHGIVTGRVLDETGGVLPGVTVSLRAATTERTTVTTAAGAYRFEDVPIGPAAIAFALLDFAVVEHAVTVDGGREVEANAVMRLALRAEVVVTAEPSLGNVADTDVPSDNLLGIARHAVGGASRHADRRRPRVGARPRREPT
jgi:hypothetical protein